MHSDDERKKLLNRLRRVTGQVDAVARMVEEDAECVDIVMQISAATGALSKVAQLLLTEHVKQCLHDAADNSNAADREAMLQDLIKLFEKYAQTK
ncbi:metal-sensitive transcriptional regulator [Rubripirellula obstinata]|nr:metal-sensitive transcriptional regulator [Rubripirellula obstinata]